jgi:hypothetical protein
MAGEVRTKKVAISRARRRAMRFMFLLFAPILLACSSGVDSRLVDGSSGVAVSVGDIPPDTAELLDLAADRISIAPIVLSEFPEIGEKLPVANRPIVFSVHRGGDFCATRFMFEGVEFMQDSATRNSS